MAELADLYHDLIIDHNKSPRNKGALPSPPARTAVGHNPLCGDKVVIYINNEVDVIHDIMFDGVGCSICTASASLMTDAVKGKTTSEIRNLFTSFHSLVTGEADAASAVDSLGKLAAFAGVSEYPVRVKCASLPWHTLIAALERDHTAVTTE